MCRIPPYSDGSRRSDESSIIEFRSDSVHAAVTNKMARHQRTGSRSEFAIDRQPRPVRDVRSGYVDVTPQDSRRQSRSTAAHPRRRSHPVEKGHSFAVFARVGFTAERIQNETVRMVVVSRVPSDQLNSVILLPLGRDRLELPLADSQKMTQKAFLVPRPPDALPSSTGVNRLVSALGSRQLTWAECEFQVSDWPEVQYYQLVVTNGVDSGSPCDNEVMTRSPGDLFAERRKSHLSLGASNAHVCNYGFLATTDEINRQMGRIIRELKRAGQYHEPADEVSTNWLERLYFSLCGGYDTPLLEREDEVHHE